MRNFAVFFQEGALSTEDELKLQTATEAHHAVL